MQMNIVWHTPAHEMSIWSNYKQQNYWYGKIRKISVSTNVSHSGTLHSIIHSFPCIGIIHVFKVTLSSVQSYPASLIYRYLLNTTKHSQSIACIWKLNEMLINYTMDSCSTSSDRSCTPWFSKSTQERYFRWIFHTMFTQRSKKVK